MITYKQGVKNGAPVINVLLDSKYVGTIAIVQEGYQYLPQGRKAYAGPVHKDLQTLFEELEND